MLVDFIRALPAAAVAAVLPGYFWAAVLRPASGMGERLAYSTGLSMATVPTVAVILARLAGTGVELWVAVVSVLLVFGSGVAVYQFAGPAKSPTGPALPRPAAVKNPRALALVAAGLLLAGLDMADHKLPAVVLLLAALALVAGGLLTLRPAQADDSPAAAPQHAHAHAGGAHADQGGGARPAAPSGGAHAAGHSGGARPAGHSGGAHAAGHAGSSAAGQSPGAHAAGTGPGMPAGLLSRPWFPGTALAGILGLTLAIVYAGVARFDWPYIRGGDSFSHAVMAEQMLEHGQYGSYLVYPPGFSTLTAVICRFAGLPPLALYPVLAPAMLLLAPLAAYALATRLWGWEYGLAAAALSGLVLTGAYNGFAEGRYPDLVSAYFLLVMAVAALITFFQAPSPRSGALLTVLGASPLWYHSVASQYLVVLMALVAVVSLAYLLGTRRGREARALTLALAGVAVLSACYAAYVYDLPGLLTGHSATSKAVSIALGTQPVLPAVSQLNAVSAPVVWFGLLGLVLLAVTLRRVREPSQVLAATAVVVWCVFMYLGSRSAADGFPQRFERDIGAVLSVLGALSLGVLGTSVIHAWRHHRTRVVQVASVAAGLAALIAAAGFVHTVTAENRRSNEVLDHEVAAAGSWLAAHNTGGTIISTPYLNPGVTNRGALALGWYTGLQSYTPRRIADPRSLPTAGRQPLLDSQTVLLHPSSCQAANVLHRDDVRYVMLYYKGPYVDRAGFSADPARYVRAFQNGQVTIYATNRSPCATS